MGQQLLRPLNVLFMRKQPGKYPGAKEAVLLAKNADKVASFCNDVLGDISGTFSGAIGAAIVVRLIYNGFGSFLNCC